MCSLENKNKYIWTNDNLCAFGVGGKCNLTTLECDCYDGFIHNFYFLRARDCSMPANLILSTHGVLLAFATFGFVFAASKWKKSAGTAKQIIISSTISQFCLMFNLIAYYINHPGLNKIRFPLLAVSVRLTYLCGYLSIYSIASPLFKMAERPEHKFVMLLKVVFVSATVIQVSERIAAYSNFGDATKPENDFGYNVHSSIGYASYGFEFVLILGILIFTANKMIVIIEYLIEMTPNNPNHSTTIVYLEKVKKFLRRMKIIVPIIIVASVLPPLIYASLGYFPFNYIPYTILSLSIPALALTFANFATRVGATESSKNKSRVLSDKNQENNNEDLRKNAALGEKNIVNSKIVSQSNYLTSYNDSKVDENL